MTGNYKGLRALSEALGGDVRGSSAGRVFFERVGKRPDEYARLLEYVQRECPYLLEDMRAAFAEAAGRERELTRNSLHDGLTGLHSRAYFDSRLAEEFSQAKRTGNPLSLVIFDIDHFKEVNDRYGHRAGDAVLRTVSGVIKRVSRRSDINARYGGEELVRLMPRTDLQGAEISASIAREKVGNASTLIDGDTIYATISGGVSSYPLDDFISTHDELVATADRALYNAKHGGRNRISSVGDMRPETVRELTRRIRGYS
ncbi:MAG: GGDEF domain-containing protein [Candidatus Aenigmarchaeota archaeon]|nr:GGDEF domain-containing protein [Candidatus Aenigmarchaeota archaeon]